MLNLPRPVVFDLAASSAVDPARFREGMSRVGAAVHVVTTDGAAGRAGFTATAVTPVTDDPATLLVCVNASGRSGRALLTNAVFCVNALAAEDVAIAEAFAGRSLDPEHDRFAFGLWDSLATGAPALTTGLAAFDCRLVEERLIATHHVFLGQIVAVRIGPDRPGLAYRGRTYRAL